jgi:hypothetical protein
VQHGQRVEVGGTPVRYSGQARIGSPSGDRPSFEIMWSTGLPTGKEIVAATITNKGATLG